MVLFELLSESAKEIAIISFALAFMSAMITKVFTTEEGKAAKQKTKDLQADMKAAQKSGDMKKMKKLQGEMMGAMMDTFRHQLRPMIITMIPFLLIFWWLKSTYGGGGAMAELFGYQLYWLGWYFVCFMLVSLPLNKLMKNY